MGTSLRRLITWQLHSSKEEVHPQSLVVALVEVILGKTSSYGGLTGSTVS